MEISTRLIDSYHEDSENFVVSEIDDRFVNIQIFHSIMKKDDVEAGKFFLSKGYFNPIIFLEIIRDYFLFCFFLKINPEFSEYSYVLGYNIMLGNSDIVDLILSKDVPIKFGITNDCCKFQTASINCFHSLIRKYPDFPSFYPDHYFILENRNFLDLYREGGFGRKVDITFSFIKKNLEFIREIRYELDIMFYMRVFNNIRKTSFQSLIYLIVCPEFRLSHKKLTVIIAKFNPERDPRKIRNIINENRNFITNRFVYQSEIDKINTAFDKMINKLITCLIIKQEQNGSFKFFKTFSQLRIC